LGELVSYRLAEGVATIVMDDGKVNALSPAMLAALNAALDQATSVGAVVIVTGRTGIFSGGFDLSTLRAGGPEAALMLEGGFALALRLLQRPGRRGGGRTLGPGGRRGGPPRDRDHGGGRLGPTRPVGPRQLEGPGP
jgi:hypothetical protein